MGARGTTSSSSTAKNSRPPSAPVRRIYFGFAWSSEKLFSRPYHNQVLNQDNSGHFDDNRWHIADSVPFQSSFEGDIEKYFTNEGGTLYAAVAYWYLDASGKDPYGPAPVGDRAGYWQSLVGADNLLEAEKLRNVNYPSHWPEAQDMAEFGTGWSAGKQLFWKGGEKDVLTLPITLNQGGKFHVLPALHQRARLRDLSG